ncbi:unnamed protein product [Amaranthus hypochondriacus]
MSSVNSNDSQIEGAQKAIARMACYVKVKPRSLCHDYGPFGRLVDTLNPTLSPCLTFESLEHNCMKLYKVDQEKVKEVFSRLGQQISLSVDIRIHQKSWSEYLSLTAHFIDDDWKLQTWVVKYCGAFRDFPIDMIVKTLNEYDIQGKIPNMTTTADAGDLADCVKENIQKVNSLPLDGKLFHVQCSCDMISRMVQKGFKLISEIIDKVQLLSWSKSLPLWYITSWKLSNALELNALGEFSSEEFNEVPSVEEWENVGSMCRIVDRIYEITKGLYEVKRPTANLFLPHMQEIRAYLVEQSASSDAFVRLVTKKMCKTFDKYWDDTYLVLSIAAFFDPRYKMKYVEFVLSDDSKAADVLNTIRKLYDGYAVQIKEYELSESSSESGDEDEGEEWEEDEIKEEGERSNEVVKKSRVNILETLNGLKEYCKSMQSADDKVLKSDLDLYLEEPVFPWKENFSVLHWWKDNCCKYPRLSSMARYFLAIPLSVVTSYEAYYTEPREVDWTVVSLKPKLMNAVMCTRSWKLGCEYD